MAAGDSLTTIKAKMEALKKLQGEISKLYALESSINEAQFKQLEALEKQENKIVAQIKAQAALNNSIKKQLENFEEMDDTMASIGNQIKKNSQFVKQQEIAFEAVKLVSESITEELKNGGTANEKTQKQVVAANDAYKSMHSSIANINKEYALGKLSNEERISQIQMQSDAFKDVLSVIDLTTISSEELKGVLEAMGKEGHSFSEAMKQSKIQTEQLDAVMGNFSGIPAMSELNTLLKTNIRDTVAFKAAVFALGAALGKAAYDYFGAPIQAAIQADKERKQNEIDNTAEVAKIRKDAESIPAQISQERLEHEIEANETIRKLTIDAQYAAQKAAIQFSSSMQMGAAQFQRAAKTALFGKGIGSVGYGAAQMQLAGIGAEKVASAMESASDATGRMPSARVGADMAIMAERTGASVENISSLSEMFQRVDGATESTAMNLTEGLRAMADQAGIGLGALTREMAEASKDMLGYQIKSGPALAKQVAYAKTLGVSFNDIAKAGKSMVMNYKDSIKNEMQLSAMLGKNVDLSEVRAKFASGDQAGAMEALKAQGLDPASMDMFQQEQLSQALGGMDLSSLQKIATKEGKNVGGLKAGSAKGGNQEFLSRTQSAESALASQQASISAQTAIIDAQLSKAIGDAYLADPGYAEYKKKQSEAAVEAAKLAAAMKDAWLQTDEYKKSLSDTTQLNFVSGLKDTLMGGLSAVLGGIGTTLLTGGGGGLLGKAKGMFTKSGPSAPSAPSSQSPMSPDITSTLSQVDAAEKPVNKALTLGKKLKDFGQGLGSFLTSIGKGVGGAIKAVLQGIGQGLVSVATGLVALTPAIPVMLAFGATVLLITPALFALAPVVIRIAEVIGDVLVKALEMAGPIITSIFNGIANVIKTVGTTISGIMDSISTSIGKFATMDAGNLGLVAAAVGALAVSVGAFGIGNVIAAIGSFFGKDIFEKLKDISGYASPLLATASAVTALAASFKLFEGIDLSGLTDLPWLKMTAFAAAGGSIVASAVTVPGNKSVADNSGKLILDKMTYISGNIEKVVDRTTKTANNTAAAAQQLKVINTNTLAMKELTRRIEALTRATYEGGTVVRIDGKTIATAVQRYESNTQGTDPASTTPISRGSKTTVG